jgi:hypothetical protein
LPQHDGGQITDETDFGFSGLTFLHRATKAKDRLPV